MAAIKAAQRLAATFSTKVSAAAEGKFKYNDGFKKVWRADGDGGAFKSKTAGAVSVGLTDPEESGNMQMDVPNIEIVLGGKKTLLTWNEAYNLADILNHVVGTAYYG